MGIYLLIDGNEVAPDVIMVADPESGVDSRAFLSDDHTAELHVPTQMLVNEFEDYALEEKQIELEPGNVAEFLFRQLTQHPQDLNVILEMASESPALPKSTFLSRLRFKKRERQAPLWLWVETLRVESSENELIVHGRILIV